MYAHLRSKQEAQSSKHNTTNDETSEEIVVATALGPATDSWV